MTKKIKKIGILTGGGDCQGLNAVIRAVTKTAVNDYGIEVVGIEDGYEGLILNKMRPLSYMDVSGILGLGGTIIGTSNTANPFSYAQTLPDGSIVKSDMSDLVVKNFKAAGLDALISIGGDGTQSASYALMAKGIPVVGVPKTIDNDLYGTDVTFGFDSATYVVAEALDRLHTTAQSHHRVMVVETMGRYAGWLALFGGMAGGADIILIPEIPYSLDVVCERVRQRSQHGKRFTQIVVAEGAPLPSGELKVNHRDESSHDPIRLGGIGVWIAREVENITGVSSRAVILGHTQRGGSPTPYDRILATRFGHAAMKCVANGEFGVMVGLRGTELITTPIPEIANRQRLVDPHSMMVATARSVGTCFGDI